MVSTLAWNERGVAPILPLGAILPTFITIYDNGFHDQDIIKALYDHLKDLRFQVGEPGGLYWVVDWGWCGWWTVLCIERIMWAGIMGILSISGIGGADVGWVVWIVGGGLSSDIILHIVNRHTDPTLHPAWPQSTNWKFVLFNDASRAHWFSYHRLLDVKHLVILTYFFGGNHLSSPRLLFPISSNRCRVGGKMELESNPHL